jgi:RpiB/LacA/LacB family sugar-phosphate isomerase
MTETIVVSSDHEGFDLKKQIKPFLESIGCEVVDMGAFSLEPVDYPLFTYEVARKVACGDYPKGIIFCGTGQGDAMTANKVTGIRAALCWDIFTARYSRAHNNSNILVLGGWLTGYRMAEEIIKVWLSTPFDGGRHKRRVEEITNIEREMLTHRGKVYDISPTIQPDMATWPGDPAIGIFASSSLGINKLTSLSLSAHTGSHVDAPLHMLAGQTGIDGLDLGVMLGVACLYQLAHVTCLDRALLEDLSLRGVTRLILGTGSTDISSEILFSKDYSFLTEDAARYLVEIGVRLLVTDSMSVDKFDTNTYPVHRTLMENDVLIVEGVNLDSVPAGYYELLCLPLKIKNGDGAPARVVLRELA